MTPRRLSLIGFSVVLAGTLLDIYSSIGHMVATLGAIGAGFGMAMRAFLGEWQRPFTVQVFPDSQTIVICPLARGEESGE